MKPSAFEYHAPRSVDEAVAVLAQLGDGAKVLGGGQSLIPMLSLRLAYFDHLVDVGRIPAMRYVRREPGAVVVGAATVDAAVEADREVATCAPLLARATPLIGHFQIRNRGTMGGSIAHADPAAEDPAVALAMGAEMEAISVRGTRRIPALRFFRDFWTTDLEPDELLVGVRFPVWNGRCGFSIREFARRHGDFAVAGAVVAVELNGDGRIERSAISLFGLGSTPRRASEAEKTVQGHKPDFPGDELGRLALSDLTEVPSDVHGSARYRTRVGAAMVKRAWDEAIAEASSA